jgi:hypothetical protein
MPTDVERIKELEQKIKYYEQNGAAKLYYALNRKMNEIADMLNNTKLAGLALEDKNDKTFERLKVLWTDSKTISDAAKVIGDSAGITGDEESDIRKNRKITTPESMAQDLGDYKTQNV